MSDEDRAKWDQRYRDGEYRPRKRPSAFLESWIDRLPHGRALDLACGAGRNALLLAERGWTVDAIDVSEFAIERARANAAERGLAVSWRVADLDDVDLEPGAYDLVTCIRYMSRRSMHRIPDALGDGGRLLFEHHLLTPLDVGGPPWGEFRLRPNELLEQFAPVLRIIHYEEGLFADLDGREMALVRMVACRGQAGF